MLATYQLISPVFSTTNGVQKICLTYYYNINGKSNDGFKILKETFGMTGNSKFAILKSQNGPYEIDQWNMDQIEVTVDSGVFRVWKL